MGLIKINGKLVKINSIAVGYTYPIYSLTLIQNANGRISADKFSGRSSDIVTLSNTPSSHYVFQNYSITGATLTSNQFSFFDKDVSAEGIFYPEAPRSITLTTDGHGKLVATKTTGYPGDTVTLTPTYSSYYRFNNYGLTGAGSINGNTYTFGDGNATIKANFKDNTFTARGLWEKGSTVRAYRDYASKITVAVPIHYAYMTASTGTIPTAWTGSNNKRWNPSNAKSYSALLNPKINTVHTAQYGAGTTAYICTRIGSTNTQGQTNTLSGPTYGGSPKTATYAYNKTFSTTSQTTYGISGYLAAIGLYNQNYNYYGRVSALAETVSGSWVATGIAP